MVYELRNVPLSSGETLPLLFYGAPYVPVKLVLYYLALDRRYKQVGTIRKDARVLKWLYEWCDLCNVDLEALLTSGQMLTRQQIFSFARWLRFGRKAPNLIAAIGNISEAAEPLILSPTTWNNYMSTIKGFLEWCSEEFIKGSVEPALGQKYFTDELTRLERTFHRLTARGKSVAIGKGLTHEQKKRLLAVVRPGSRHNPFRSEVQFRNYLIVVLLLFAGIRRGELLSLWAEDCPTRSNGYLLLIRKRPEDPNDPRNPKPSVKTLERDIKMDDFVAQLCQEYIDEHRIIVSKDPVAGRVKRRKPKHPYLLISSHGSGAPLSLDAAYDVIVAAGAAAFPEGDVDIYTHILRNTFCNDFMEEAVDIQGKDLEVAKDALRRICGWSERSSMPDLYAMKWRQQTAEAINLARLAKEHMADQDQ